jgi:hypothetical protein
MCCGKGACQSNQQCCTTCSVPFCASKSSVCCGATACAKGQVCCGGVCCESSQCHNNKCTVSKR